MLAWLIAFPYRGLEHDAQLYAFQGLNRLDPLLLGADLFIRLGSQDDFTLFPVIVAWVISMIGVEHSAALITLVSFFILVAACGWLASRLVSRDAAVLAVIFLLIMPAQYGSHGIFQVAEMFLSPRVLAEACVVGACAWALAGRGIPAFALAGLGMAFHPLMALPGLLLLIAIRVDWRQMWLLAVTAALILAAVLGVARYAPIGSVAVIDPDWLEVIRARSLFLFLDRWQLADWSKIAVVCGTLALAVFAHRGEPAARLAARSIVIGGGGLVIAAIASFLPVEILLKGQPWRWTWLPTLLAVLLLPSTAMQLWYRGAAARASAILIVLAWVARDLAGLPLGCAAVACSVLIGRIAGREERLLLWGAVAAALTAFAWWLVTVIMLPAFPLGREPELMERIRNILGISGSLVLLVASAWLTCRQVARPAMMLPVALFVAATLPFATRTAYGAWTAAPMETAARNVFQPWREVIPPGTAVLWLDNPVAVWFLLERPSYLSRSQSAGVVFSRGTALEVQRRAKVLTPLVDPDWMVGLRNDLEAGPRAVTAEILYRICADPLLGFVVSKSDPTGRSPTVEWPDPGKQLSLITCSAFRPLPDG